jgi:hypothetical protein
MQADTAVGTSRLPHCLHNRLTDGVKVVSLTRWPHFTPRKIPATYFPLEAQSNPGPYCGPKNCRVCQTQLGSFWSLITDQSNNTRENGKVPFVAAAIYRQQKVLSHFPVCCWIDRLLMIKYCLKLVVCILLRVLGQVEGFRLTQHWFEYFI